MGHKRFWEGSVLPLGAYLELHGRGACAVATYSGPAYTKKFVVGDDDVGTVAEYDLDQLMGVIGPGGSWLWQGQLRPDYCGRRVLEKLMAFPTAPV